MPYNLGLDFKGIIKYDMNHPSHFKVVAIESFWWQGFFVNFR